ncbi:Nuclease domain-containing protein 1 [Choanephora cucurbitarum]|uniref:Nuclease domain-containing protein 1 n=1 Tax=Choanephora cucurbitarum TaxID=101091 RepID=A0A1C7NH35_9FUNG|nr:Nuclease domain-containing protein 1 [Choanephora cucurbitarum]
MVNKAVVKNVLSGDTVILRGKPRPNGPPAERLLALSHVQAPRLGNTTRSDEPFGFQAREFLRKLVVGKEVSFVSDYTVPTTQREYGTIYLSNGDNVAELGVKAGWLKVREGKTTREDQEEQLEKLQDLQKEAEDARLGLWSDDQSKGVRQVSFNFDGDGRAFLNKHKGKPLDAVIEQVRDGSTFRVLLILPDGTQQIITLFLSGIKAPACKRDNSDDISEPFGEECKFFVESRLLQRGVKVILEGLAQSNGQNFVGSIQHPAGNIAELLLAQGLAKCVDWSIPLATSGPTPLRNAEKQAKEKKLRLWRDFVSKKVNSDATDFDATVVRILTGDTLVVKPKNGAEKKIQLSSVKQAPRGAGSSAPNAKSRDVKEVGYQFEAREFLRKKLIGKQVHVTMDYHKPAQDGFEAKDCATVTLGSQNIAEQLIVRGLATVIRHRKDDDNRSHCYDQLLVAEKKAQEEQKGVHSPKDPPVVRIVDASESAAKSRQFLTFLKRSGKTAAVVEHVANGSRLFVWVPKENCRLSFVLSGVRAPRVGRTPQDKSEPFGQEALDFVSQKCLQHDVEIEVENVDKVGGFVGSLFVHGENLAVALLAKGLAHIHEYSADESNYVNQLYGAEREAKSEKKGLWADYTEAANDQQQENSSGPNREYIDVIVSDIISGSHFYVQKITDEIPKLEKLMSELGQYQNSRPADPSFRPRVGDNVSAKFTEDNCWYRGRVRRVSHEGIEVLYIDYGNSETLPSSRVRALPENFKQLKPQAFEATLSFIQSPERDQDYGIEAVERFRDLTANKQLVANVDAREGNVLCLTLYDFRKSTSAEASVNLDMVQDGQAVVTPKVRYARGNESILRALEEAQQEAIRRRLGMFEYGDITGNEDVTSTSYY